MGDDEKPRTLPDVSICRASAVIEYFSQCHVVEPKCEHARFFGKVTYCTSSAHKEIVALTKKLSEEENRSLRRSN
jgi:hypothetical protein